MNLGQIMTPHEAMARAIAEARKGWGMVSPNPLVGCVIVDAHHQLLGVGAHMRLGGAHAEIEALNSIKANAALKGATVYVTLEPCAHQGRTPSCAKHLAELPLSKVVYGLEDPNPLVSGKGAEILKSHGIECEKFEGLQDELEDLAEHFLMNQRRQLPFVALKVATTYDGFLGMRDGRSQWITSEESRLRARRLRSGFDAVLVGVGTLLSDNPRLDLRDMGARQENQVVVLDPEGRGKEALEGSELVRWRSPGKVIWVTGSQVGKAPERVVHLDQPLHDNQFDLNLLLRTLYQKGITSVFVEGGAHTFSQFLAQAAAHRLYNFVSLSLLGSTLGQSWTKDLKTPGLNDRIQLLNAKCDFLNDQEVLFTSRFGGHSAFDGKPVRA